MSREHNVRDHGSFLSIVKQGVWWNQSMEADNSLLFLLGVHLAPPIGRLN